MNYTLTEVRQFEKRKSPPEHNRLHFKIPLQITPYHEITVYRYSVTFLLKKEQLIRYLTCISLVSVRLVISTGWGA